MNDEMSSTLIKLERKQSNDSLIVISSDEEYEEVRPPLKKIKVIDGPVKKESINPEEIIEWVKEPDRKRKIQNNPCSSKMNLQSIAQKQRKPKEELFFPSWEPYEILCEEQGIPENIAENIISLLDEDNTIPFMCRYRRNEIGNLNPEELRSCKDTYEKSLALKSKMKTVIKAIEMKTEISVDMKNSILGIRNIDVLEEVYAPYKEKKINSLMERAKAVNLEKPALSLLNGIYLPLHKYVGTFESLIDIEYVKKGIQHIIAHVIATDPETLLFLRNLKKEYLHFIIECKQSIKRKTDSYDKKENVKKVTDESKFKLYLGYHAEIRNIKPHQILAINRAEKLKIISVKVKIPLKYETNFLNFCRTKWIENKMFNEEGAIILLAAIDDCYKRIVSSLVKREIRSELKFKAETEAVSVFTGNLKQILLGMPSKGISILGIDPGFTHGCKLGLISETGSVIETDVIYLHKNNLKKKFEDKIASLLKKNNCSLIALGNGTACREMEAWISDMISRGLFYPLDVKYTIVNESGASVYSCSQEAKKEFPSMDPNLISAVSLARRVQEPLVELVKVEPRHLGVGMYQHDIPPKRLDEALNEVISECVSYVGVDLNTTSQCLLRRVAGLSDKKATEIIKYRETKGLFTTREDLKKVKGIGENTFKQCAGFLRIGSPGLGRSSNKLDLTIIHPESYGIALNVIKTLSLCEKDIGSEAFITKIKNSESRILNDFKSFKTNVDVLRLILDGLSRPVNYDFREHGENKPLFKKGLTDINDLKVGTELTGCVTNVVPFGCFVDLGVGQNGLIHTSKLNGYTLQIGSRVEVAVLSVDIAGRRIGLALLKEIK